MVLEELLRLGPVETNSLALALRMPTEALHVRSEPGDEHGRRTGESGIRRLNDLRRELKHLGWIEYRDRRWSLTEEGTRLAQSRPTENLFRFARELCLAGEGAYGKIISGLLARMWQLSPELQGAVLLPVPRLGQIPDHADKVQDWLRPILLAQMQKVRSYAPGLDLSSSDDDVAAGVSAELPASWEHLQMFRRRDHLRRLIEERTLAWLFGCLASPAEVKGWQTRMDLAGLTLLARRLPKAPGKVWFPVGAFRESAGPAFVSMPGLAQDGQSWYCHEPAGPEAEASLADSLFAAYKESRRRERTEYVSLAVVRDVVCYQLRIAHERFQSLLQGAFPRMLQGELPYAISLEVDAAPQEKIRTAGSLPIIIDNVPRFIIAMGRRRATD